MKLSVLILLIAEAFLSSHEILGNEILPKAMSRVMEKKYQPDLDSVLENFIQNNCDLQLCIDSSNLKLENSLNFNWNHTSLNIKKVVQKIVELIRNQHFAAANKKLGKNLKLIPYIVKQLFNNDLENINIIFKFLNNMKSIRTKVDFYKWVVYELHRYRSDRAVITVQLKLLNKIRKQLSLAKFSRVLTYFGNPIMFNSKYKLIAIKFLLKKDIIENARNHIVDEIKPNDVYVFDLKKLPNQIKEYFNKEDYNQLKILVTEKLYGRMKLRPILYFIMNAFTDNDKQKALPLFKTVLNKISKNSVSNNFDEYLDFALYFKKYLKGLNMKLSRKNTILMEAIKANIPQNIRNLFFASRFYLRNPKDGHYLSKSFKNYTFITNEGIEFTGWTLTHNKVSEIDKLRLMWTIRENVLFDRIWIRSQNFEFLLVEHHPFQNMMTVVASREEEDGKWQFLYKNNGIVLENKNYGHICYGPLGFGIEIGSSCTPVKWEVIDCSRE